MRGEQTLSVYREFTKAGVIFGSNDSLGRHAWLKAMPPVTSDISLAGVNMDTLSMPIDEAAETPKCSPGTSNTLSPFDISPVPNIKKRTTTRDAKQQGPASSLDHHTRIS
ncbi:hypothetical protein AVEN_138850-1 [Araneus ventricosus]|uniref:Uncharacterized protein n=1 Tax=Araneus ventricosus TaxID=182803 RepID=A0A4Y2G899_ARAVE|nr:hypothetical protein AVEN_138850-1 [Araneus ventricosus]